MSQQGSDKATPRPWKIVGIEDLNEQGIDDVMIVADNPGEEWVANLGADISLVVNPQVGAANLANGKFICEAVNSIDALREENARMRKMLKEQHSAYVNLDMGEMSFRHRDESCDICSFLAGR